MHWWGYSKLCNLPNVNIILPQMKKIKATKDAHYLTLHYFYIIGALIFDIIEQMDSI
jgi:hypothetical protein